MRPVEIALCRYRRDPRLTPLARAVVLRMAQVRTVDWTADDWTRAIGEVLEMMP